MKANVNARPISFILAALLAALLLAATTQAFALEKVTAQATSENSSYPANTWAPLNVQINNESAYDITIEEAGFYSVPDGLEKRGELVTTYGNGALVVKAGTSSYTTVHEMEVRKVVASPQKTPPVSKPNAI